MAVRVMRTSFDFLAKNYATSSPQIELLGQNFDRSTVRAQPQCKENFVERWYLSLQGEEAPATSSAQVCEDKSKEKIYRYDWAFGITLIQGFWWDWQAELCRNEAFAIHVLLDGEKNAPEAIPIAGTLSALRPSRNTRSAWEMTRPAVSRAVVDAVKIGAITAPGLNYVATGLAAASNVLDSSTENHKNWFLYQFFDENSRCPTVEWRIDRQVMREYGPLLRGTLYLMFHGSAKQNPGRIRIRLRPQARYYDKGDLDFIIPTEKLAEKDQVFLDISPQDSN